MFRRTEFDSQVGKMQLREGADSHAPTVAIRKSRAEDTVDGPAVPPWQRVWRQPLQDPVGSHWTPAQAPRHVEGSACTSVTLRTRVVWPTRGQDEWSETTPPSR